MRRKRVGENPIIDIADGLLWEWHKQWEDAVEKGNGMEANTFRREEREKAGSQQQLGHDAHAVLSHRGLVFRTIRPADRYYFRLLNAKT